MTSGQPFFEDSFRNPQLRPWTPKFSCEKYGARNDIWAAGQKKNYPSVILARIFWDFFGNIDFLNEFWPPGGVPMASSRNLELDCGPDAPRSFFWAPFKQFLLFT